MRVAVLGAGLAGACVALELAEAGCEVDLYERAQLPLSRASFNNEGKVHLGLVYAKDESDQTARMMIRGAVRFRALLERWVSSASIDVALSPPFLYAVPRDSMLASEEIRRHFERVSTIFELASRAAGSRYVQPVETVMWRDLGRGAFSAIFDPARVLCAFETQERAIDPTRLCASLRAALASAVRLALRCRTEVEVVGHNGRDGLQVRSRHAEQRLIETYDAVVNALWEQRLAMDASMGLPASRPVSHRYKVGLRTNDKRVSANLPTVTFMLGAFGDTVAYPDYAYASWYPTGLLRQEFALRPSLPEPAPGPGAREEIIERSLAGLRDLMPGVSGLLDPSAAEWEIVGGYITAWGNSGIDDGGSELHQRYAVGVSSHGNYHTIDTGKMTLAPLFAAEACSRILGRKS